MPPSMLGSVTAIPTSTGSVFEWNPVYTLATPYASGNAVGVKTALPLPPELVGKIVVVQSASLVCAEFGTLAYFLAILNEDYTDPGDLAAFTLSAADTMKVVDMRSMPVGLPIGPTADPGFHKDPVPVLVNAKSASLWAQLVIGGAATFVGAGHLRIRLGVALG